MPRFFMMRSISIVFAAVMLCLAGAPPARANLSITPVVTEMEASGQKNSVRLTVSNRQNQLVLLDTGVDEVTYNPDGTTTRRSADSEFFIVPTQANVAANRSQAFRVQYVGSEASRGRTFLARFAQVPLEPTPGSSSLQVTFTIEALIVVNPPGATDQTKVLSARASIKDGKTLLEIVCENGGNRVGSVGRRGLTIRSGSAQVQLDQRAVESALGYGVVPAGGRRTLSMPMPSGLPTSGQFTVELR